MTRQTIVSGMAADSLGLVHSYRVFREDLADGNYEAWKEDELKLEPADVYASSHPRAATHEMAHGEDIRRIVALRRAHGRLYAIGESELEPEQLGSSASAEGR